MRFFSVMILLLLMTGAVRLNAQVEVPSGTSCKVMKKDRLTYCVNTDNYEVNWIATKLYGKDILQKKFVPSANIEGIPQQISELWLEIEKQVQLWSVEFDSLYVVTGRTQLNNDSTIMKNGFYKAILKGCQGDAIGFFVDDSFAPDKNIKSCTITIDSLEKVTKLDFFPTLNVDLQDIIESSFDPKFWPITVSDN